jgi:hypothetical protein
MGLSAPILQDIESLAREAAQGMPSLEEDKAAKGRWIAEVEKLATCTHHLRESNRELHESLTEFFGPLPPNRVALEAVIETLRAAEQHLKNEMKPGFDRLDLIRRETFALQIATPGERARVLAIVDRHKSTVTESAELLRDFRWKAMAMRADLEGGGDAPVFDDPEELVAYLNSNSG